MHSCSRCVELPQEAPTCGYFFIAPPEPMSIGRLRTALADLQIEMREVLSGIYQFPYTADTLQQLTDAHFVNLSLIEQQDTRCLLLQQDAVPDIGALLRMRPLSAVVADVQGQWLRSVMQRKQLFSYFQPILECQDPSRIHAYECLLRGRKEDGQLIFPNQLFPYAKSADLLFQLDRAARLAAISSAERQGLQSSLFINFMPTSIYNPEFCLRTTVAAIEHANLQPAQIVFEVTESEEVQDVGHLLNILKYYRAHGYQVALDDLGAGYNSLNLLHQLQPDYIKLDMGLVRDVDKDPYKARISANLLSLARELGVKTIAEGIETQGEWQWLCEQKADLVQGYLFAKPAEVPPIPKVPGSMSV